MFNSYKKRMAVIRKKQNRKTAISNKERGVIIVNTGDGKGKSTAAFGTVLRAVGQGLKVAVVQFIKGDWHTGEGEVFKQFDNITHIICGKGFTWETADHNKDIEAAQRGWNFAKKVCLDSSCEYQLLVLDELNLALKYKLVDLTEVIKIIKNKPDRLNIIITGRDAPREIIKIADTVSEIKCVKHAFDRGIKAQRGIDF